eukprot:jgi/Hompol1/4063/HPOL_006901-RA
MLPHHTQPRVEQQYFTTSATPTRSNAALQQLSMTLGLPAASLLSSSSSPFSIDPALLQQYVGSLAASMQVPPTTTPQPYTSNPTTLSQMLASHPATNGNIAGHNHHMFNQSASDYSLGIPPSITQAATTAAAAAAALSSAGPGSAMNGMDAPVMTSSSNSNSSAASKGKQPIRTDQAKEEEDDKRRRNTAASARFRAKKKAREQAVEQTARELSERVQLLERQLHEQTMEIKWLRQLVTDRDGIKRLRDVYEE